MIATSFAKPELSRNNGLVVADDGVMFAAGDGVAGVREDEAIGDDGGE